MTREQIKLFDSRIVDNDDSIPPQAVYLFYKNEDVDACNVRLIAKKSGYLFQCDAVDIVKGKDANSSGALQKLKVFKNTIQPKQIKEKLKVLPNTISFKKDCKYMVTTNLNTKDGIVNGAVGTLKFVEENPYPNEPSVGKVFLDFGNKYTGQMTREKAMKNPKYITQKLNKNFNTNLIPIDFLEYMLFTSQQKGAIYKIVRCQYPLVPCEAMTIHKSQGQTLEVVAVDINKQQCLNREKRYVAFSRVTSLDTLYLFGDNTIVPEQERNLDRKTKKKMMQDIDNDEVHTEMRRLKEDKHRMENKFFFISETYLSQKSQMNSNIFSIMFQNIQSWNDNKRSIINKDIGFNNVDLIHFCSTNLRPDHRHLLTLAKYDLIHSTTSNIQSYGTLTYLSKEKKDWFHLVYSNANVYREINKPNQVEINIFKYNLNIYIDTYCVFLYKHPKTSFQELVDSIATSLKQINYAYDNFGMGVILMGDFNVDFNKHPNLLTQFQKKFKVSPLFLNQPTNNYGNHIDWIFTSLATLNKIELIGTTYESFISDHKPLFFEVKY